jgi:predicted nucleic acid-binding protein
VVYECLYKPRKQPSAHDQELQDRLRRAQSRDSFTSYPLALEDLQDLHVLENRKRLGKGELSSIAFAQKTGQAFLSDDQKARRLAAAVLETPVQTTPHLFSWLVYERHLTDGDKQTVIAQHEEVGRPLRRYLEDAYLEGLRCRYMSSTRPAD